MSYEIVFSGHVEGSVRTALCDLLGDAAIRHEGATVVLSIRDQAELVTAMARLQDLSIAIDLIRSTSPRAGPG